MIKWYDTLPIADKLRLLLMTGSLVIILSFSVIYIYYGAHSLRENLETETINSVNLAGSRNVAAIRFNNSDFASESLKALNTDGSYIKMCLYNGDTKIFSSFPPSAPCPSITRLQNGAFSESVSRQNGNFIVIKNIIADGEFVGAILAERALGAVHLYVQNQLKTMLVIACISLLINYFVGNYLQRMVSRPIMEIAQNVRTIAVEPMAHHRITRQYGDNELGQVAEAFNRILTQMEDRLKEVSYKNLDLTKAHNLTLRRLEDLLKQFVDSADAFYAVTEITAHTYAGSNKNEYIAYQNDVSESLGLYGANLEALLKISRVYADSLASPRVVINIGEYLALFAQKLKNTVPFLSIELSGNLGRQMLPIGVYRAAWDEIFSILSKLYVTLIGIVDFTPSLKIEIVSDPACLYLSFGDNSNSAKHRDAPTLNTKFGDLDVGFDEVSYKKNSIEDPEVGEDFLNEEFLHRADLQYILETIVYIANANSITVTHHFEMGKFMLCLEINSVFQEAIEIEKRLALQ